ncbi:MAG TPA: GNAT family N-acetyltransferase [Pyrinomonadaceae bacterium]|jgi:RimJ/RimL family protein N-acetyltransferase|nr:GNAT family N-acetyltransferase [Pyrinomonadaceae bacterium]
MSLIETERLSLREFSADDAAFILELLNEPSFIRNIADKGVRTLDDAVRYISDGPVASYRRHGFGPWMVELKDSRVPIGMCGLTKKDALTDADIGYAFLPRHRSQGYAYEAAAAVMRHARDVLGLPRLLGVVNPGNAASIRVLEKLGLRYERMVSLDADKPDVMLFTTGL